MKMYGYVVVAAIAVLLVSLGFTSAAQAGSDVRVDLTVEHQVLYAGESFTATGTSNVDCDWNLDWNDVVRESGATKKFATTYVAPQVSKVTKIRLTAACDYTSPTAEKTKIGGSTWKRVATIAVLPQPSGAAVAPVDNSANLQGAGGPNVVFLLSGLVLLLSGVTAVTVARRRPEEVELPGQTA